MKSTGIIIIGCGPAGMACAIQLKRMGLDPLVIEKDRPGGMLPNANLIENYPGFPGGIAGLLLARRMTEQFNSFRIKSITDEITGILYNDGIFHLHGRFEDYNTPVLVIASGTVPIIPEIPIEYVNEGLIHFDISRLRTVSGKTIGIIGAGDAAFDYSLSLAENENEVYIFNRGTGIKALKSLSDKVVINNHIKYQEKHPLNKLELVDNKALIAIFNSTSGNSKYSLDYLIFAIGRIPGNAFFREGLEDKLPGLVKQHRLYLIGDLSNGNCRQVSVAVGDGVKAAMEIFRNESNQ